MIFAILISALTTLTYLGLILKSDVLHQYDNWWEQFWTSVTGLFDVLRALSFRLICLAGLWSMASRFLASTVIEPHHVKPKPAVHRNANFAKFITGTRHPRLSSWLWRKSKCYADKPIIVNRLNSLIPIDQNAP